MSLRPVEVPVPKPYVPKPPGERAERKKEVQGRTDVYRAMHELRARTILRDEDDPLHDTDWWSIVEDTPRTPKNAYRRVHRIKTETILPKGLWSIRAKDVDGSHLIIARFEGYKPWWLHASKAAWHSSFHKVLESTFEERPRPPQIPITAYEDIIEPSRHVVQDRQPS